MSKSLVATVGRWKFETPLALALGAATLFAVLAQPPALVAALPVLGFSPAMRFAFGLIAGCVLGTLGYIAMCFPYGVSTPRAVGPVEEDDSSGLAASDVSVRLRRADRHPDAPAREPIRASRELGSPFMEVGAFASRPADPLPPLPVPPRIVSETVVEPPLPIAEPIVEQPIAPDAAITEREPDTQAMPDVREPMMSDPGVVVVFAPDEVEARPIADEPIDDAPATSSSIAHEIVADAGPGAVEPLAEPAEPVAEAADPVARQSLAAMMERLSSGFAGRVATNDQPDTQAAPRQRDLEPELTQVLAELNRLAARRAH